MSSSKFHINDERRFAATREELSTARAYLTSLLRPYCVDAVIDDVVLCFSEAFTNALRHSRSGLTRDQAAHLPVAERPEGVITLRAYAFKDSPLCVDVQDEGPRVLGAIPHLDPGGLEWDAESGRGLHLIERLTRHWMYLSGQRRGCLCLSFDPGPQPALTR